MILEVDNLKLAHILYFRLALECYRVKDQTSSDLFPYKVLQMIAL